jgi:hypothetical protein
VLGAAVVIGAQTPPQKPYVAQTPPRPSDDPRVGLKPGLQDAGVAAKNLELVAHMPKPDGFQDPTGGFNFMNSDVAFQGPHLFQGNFNGFNFYNVEDPRKPQLRVSMVCPGGQGDLSVYKNLLFMSVEETRGRVDCGSQGVQGISSTERFRGVRIFDITNIDKPKQIAAVQTCRGSHTHTLVVDPKDPNNIYIYGSGTAGVRQATELDSCVGDPKDPNTSLFSIDVIQVPLKAPETAKIVNRPRIFADSATGAPNGLWQGGAHGAETQTSFITNQCHDITTYPALGLAAGACSGNGILLDISDPVHPKRLDAVTDNAFAYWHSATFNNDGTKVLFSDEWGGGTSPFCRNTDPLTWGADAIFDIVDKKLVFGNYYKMPAPQTEFENCVAHNGSIVPVPGRDIMVQAWYQGGLSMFDFTDAKNPVEIAYFDRGPIDEKRMMMGGSWSAYWYNGVIVSSEIARGLDIYELLPSGLISENELAAAKTVKTPYLNTQDQQKIVWVPSFALARAYLDQLERSKGLASETIATARTTLASAERSGSQRKAALTQLASQLNTAAASARDQAKVRVLSTAVSDLSNATR